jgi:hypothetical protein
MNMQTKFRIEAQMKTGPVEWAPLSSPWQGPQPLPLFDTARAAADWLDGAYPTWTRFDYFQGLQRLRIVEVE